MSEAGFTDKQEIRSQASNPDSRKKKKNQNKTEAGYMLKKQGASVGYGDSGAV